MIGTSSLRFFSSTCSRSSRNTQRLIVASSYATQIVSRFSSATIGSVKQLSTLSHVQPAVGTDFPIPPIATSRDPKPKLHKIVTTTKQQYQNPSKQFNTPIPSNVSSSVKDHEYRLARSEDYLEITWPGTF